MDPHALTELPAHQPKHAGRIRAASARLVLEAGVLAVAYVVAARMGLALATANPNVTGVWPPSGIAVAALMLRGRRLWPGVALGAFVANLANGLDPHVAAGIAVGNTLAPLAAVTLLQRLDVRKSLSRVRDVLLLFLGGAAIPMVVSATLGTAVLAAAGALGGSPAASLWLLWWAGDAMGVVVYAPFLLTAFAIPLLESPVRRKPVEAALLLALGAGATALALRSDLQIRFLVLPVAMWIAMEFEQHGASASTLVLSSIALWHSSAVVQTGESQLVVLQGLNATLALLLLSFAAIMSERRRAQDELRRAAADLENRIKVRTRDLLESEERLEQAQRLAHIGSFQWNAHTDTNLWSAELFRIYGLPPSGGPPGFEDYMSFVRADERDRVREGVEAAIAEGGSVGHEHPIVLRDGTVKWVHAFVEVLTGPDGELAGLRGTCQDVTDRKQAEHALRAGEEKLRALLGSAPDALVVADDRGAITLINDQLTNLLGFEPEELLGRKVEMLLPEGLSGVHRKHRLDYAADPRRRPMGAGRDLCARHRDGSLVPVDISLAPVGTEDGMLIFASLRDATDRRAVEEALRSALDREREASDYLRHLDAAKNDFLSAVSHELRTPLTTILGFIQLLREGQVDEETTRHMLERVDANAQRLQKLLGDLLDIDRLHRGIVAPSRRHADLRDLIDGTIASMDLRGHPLTVKAPSADVFIDPAQAERIVENLLSNAVKYTPHGSRIWVEATPHGDGGVTFVVSDEGHGVPPELREEVFQPFFHGRDTFTQGTGIGLSLVQRFAHLHGGRAWVEERPGGGSSFLVKLPGAEGQADTAVA